MCTRDQKLKGLLHICVTDVSFSLTSWQHSSLLSERMSGQPSWNFDVKSEIWLRQSILIYAKFHPDLFWKDIALGFFVKSRYGHHLESMTSYLKSSQVAFNRIVASALSHKRNTKYSAIQCEESITPIHRSWKTTRPIKLLNLILSRDAYSLEE